jgi:hypothetical protein
MRSAFNFRRVFPSFFNPGMMGVFLALFLVLFASPGKAQVAPVVTYNAVTNGETSGAVASLTYAHNVGARTNKVLIVSTAFESATGNYVTGITYNAVAMTLIGRIQMGTNLDLEVGLWYMLDDQLPDDNANHNVVVSFASNASNAIESGAISLYDAKQVAPTDYGGTSTTTADPVTRAYTTAVNNMMAVDVVGCGNSGTYTATGQTERWDNNVNTTFTGAGGTRAIAAAGNYTNSWNYSATINRQAMYVAGVESTPETHPIFYNNDF